MLKEGQVLTLPKGLFVRKDVAGSERVSGLIEDVRVLVEASWKAAIGSEDDHFMTCELAKCRTFPKGGKYDPTADSFIIATAGDFNDRFILKDAERLVEDMTYTKTYVLAE
jgi:hypothetical protein